MKNKPEISIIIANYNNSKYIRRCVNSCLYQDFKKKYEIIFVDDASTDNSISEIKKFKNKIKIIQIKNYKKVIKFNTFFQLNTYKIGLKKASGNIICFLDSDDFFKINKLSQIYKVFKLNNELKVVFDRPIFFFNKSLTIKSVEKFGLRYNKWPKFPAQSCISAKKIFLQKNDKKIFNKKFSLLTLDFRIAVLASKIEKNIYFLEKHLTYYFQHDNSETSKKFKFLNKNWFNRRLQAFNFYSDNYKMSLNLDYIITRLVNILF